MGRVSMTLPQYRRRECVVGGVPVRLTGMEAELLAVLLVTPPNRVADKEMLVEALWPDPDTQPLTALHVIEQLALRLRRKRILVSNEYGRGLSLSGRARGGRAAPLATFVSRCAGCDRRLAA